MLDTWVNHVSAVNMKSDWKGQEPFAPSLDLGIHQGRRLTCKPLKIQRGVACPNTHM